MLTSKKRMRLRSINEDGINMVDLMMWLVIAVLLLSAALQSIGYYRQATNLNVLKSDLSGVGSRVMAAASTNGTLARDAIAVGASESNWSKGVSYAVQSTGEGAVPYLRAAHEHVGNVDVIYLFAACGTYGPGINVVSKNGDPSCGIAPSGGEGQVTIGASGWKWQEKPDAAPTAESGVWRSSALSDDGSKMIVGGWHGYLSSSANAGGFWSINTPSTTQRNDVWRDLDSSADGKKITAIGEQGGSGGLSYIYVSSNSGTTMTQLSSAGMRNWWTAAMSDDGTIMIAAEDTGVASISRDSGATWNDIAALGNENWSALDTSSDGKHIVAASIGTAKNGNLYVSHDSGAAWTKLDSAGSAGWRGLAISNDGTKIVASRDGGGVYTSTNGGTSWTDHTSTLGLGRYLSLGASDDGNSIVVGRYDNGYVFTSSNGGSGWERQDGLGAHGWHAVGMSGDGSKIVATKNDAVVLVGEKG